MIELMILFVLMKRDFTMYGIHKRILERFQPFTNPSFGAIKPALVRLEKSGFLTTSKLMSDGGKLSIYYSITDSGLKELRKLLLKPITKNPLQFISEAKIRLCCASFLSSDDAKLMYELIPFGPCKKILLENPIDIKKGEWREINETVKNLTYGHTKRIYLRSTLEYPAPCSPLSQTISIYGGEGEHIYILDRQKKDFNPIGISYDEALKMTAGGIQFEGITAQARKTIFEKTFLIDNGGLKNSITPYEI